ncbi:hypothetical protein QQX98_003809 [Neonectria punicea]|uniref:Uncharacterized protein n=1 Tax=Neonectria punicea TaxID=979145 RepID=A0ABR1HDI9_9HYPO
MVLRTLRDLWRSQSADLPNVDHLRIPKNIIEASVTRQQCIAHLYLLEQFVSAKSKVTRWGNFNQIPPESAWKFYVNMAVERMARWFELSRDMDLRHIIPPLDVLMVWHALLQRPDEWDAFVDLTRVDHHQWDWNLLLRTLQATDMGRFQLPRESRDVVRQLYPTPDLLELMDVSTSFLISPNPDRTTEHLAHLYLHRRRIASFKTPRGEVEIRFDFHAVVDAQLSFANRVLQYSWHRMYSPERAEDSQFGTTIERYKKFMTLVQFSSDIQSLGPLAREPPQPLVPTLDIDLVWRTHMLSPREFRWLSTHIYGRLIQHTPSRDQGYNQTARIYRHVFGEEYGLCLCWPCVDGRETRRFSPITWSPRPTFEEERAQEHKRRHASVIDVPFKFGVKQCKKCGFHRRRGCKEKDAIDIVEPPVRTIHQSKRTQRSALNMAIAHRVPAPWWVNQGSSSSPEPMSRRAAVDDSKVGERIQPSIPPLRHKYQRIPSSQRAWANEDSFQSTATKAIARTLSNESLFSAGGQGDSNRANIFTLTPSVFKPPPHDPPEAGPSSFSGDQTPSYYRAPRSAASRGRGSHMGIDVGLWMAKSRPH